MFCFYKESSTTLNVCGTIHEAKRENKGFYITDQWATKIGPCVLGPWLRVGTRESNRKRKELKKEKALQLKRGVNWRRRATGDWRQLWIFTYTISHSLTSISTFPVRSSSLSLAPLWSLPLLIWSQLLETLPGQIPALRSTGMMDPLLCLSAWIGVLPPGNGYAIILILILILSLFGFRESREEMNLNRWKEEFDKFESCVPLNF